MDSAGDAWRVSLTLPSDDHLDAFEAALEPFGGALSTVEVGADGARGSGQWRIIAYGLVSPDRAELVARIALAARARGIAVPAVEMERLPETDWVAHVVDTSPPVTAGRFFVHGSHFAGDIPPGSVPILIDATRAFGSGTHESTRGCLIAMDRLLSSRKPAEILDLGTGSGILAIAAAKTTSAAILASDNDAAAVAIARENIELNGVADRIRTVVSQGFRNPALHRRPPFDWIIANILARPLIGLAPAIVGRLNPGGIAILAGFLRDQAAAVEDSYVRHGATVIDTVDLNDWRTTVVARNGGSG